MALLFSTTLFLNMLWFSIGFLFFSVQSTKAAKLLVKIKDTQTNFFLILTHSLKFLGGINVSLAFFSFLLLFTQHVFPNAIQKAIFAIVFTIAHFSQFFYNISIARHECTNKNPLWSVLTGSMLFIFIGDGVLTLLNFSCFIVFLCSI